jgi:hypothetical protein
MLITREEILKDYRTGIVETIPSTLEANLKKLMEALNKFRAIYGKPMMVTSGYRNPKKNTAIGGAKKSNHIICLACDFADTESKLDSYCVANQDVLEECGLYLEHPKWTNNWCHLQTVKPLSGKRIFIPSAQEPIKEKLDELFIDLKV